ncbi:MAG TPA: murein biosynthesis integral membrane protein MurJ [Spirochaetia bacterium]|nr:murein biosynthesis integral membrane protein MurJ [Spirochaetia bacterium]
MTSKKRNIVVSAVKMSGTTMLSRLFGLVRDQFQANFLGTSWASDAFTVAYQIPNLLRRLFAEGSMTASFIPVFMDVEKERTQEEAHRFFASFFTLLFLVVALVVLAGVLAAPYIVKLLYLAGSVSQEKYVLTVHLTRLMFPYILVISLAALLQGILNIRNNFTVPAFTPVLLNLSIIGSVLVGYFFFPATFKNITTAFAVGVLIGGVIQVLFQVPFFLKTGYRIFPAFRFRDPDIRRVGRLFTPGIFGVGIYQINVLVSFGFASALGVGRQSAIMFASRINELTLGVFAVSLATVMLPTLSKQVSEANREEFLESIAYSLRLLALVTIPAAIGLFVLSDDIVRLLLKFGKFSSTSVILVSSTLRYYSLALFFIASYRIITQSFYSLKDTRTPVYVSFFTLLLNATLCYFLPRFFSGDQNIIGIALANTISNSLNFFILFFLLKRKLGGVRLIRRGISFAQTLGASLVMGAVALGAQQYFLQDLTKLELLWRLVFVIAICATVYFAANLLFGNSETKAVVRQLTKRRDRR